MKLINRAKMTTATTGTGTTISLGSAVAGFQSFADAGLVDGQQSRFSFEDGDAWQLVTATYNASGPTITINSVIESSNAGAAINLSGSAVVFGTALAEDVGGLVLVGTPQVVTSAVSAVDFDMPAEYSRFRLILQDVDMTGTYSIFRFSIDGGATFIATSTHREYVVERRIGSATDLSANIINDTGITFTQNCNAAINGAYDIITSVDQASVHGRYTGSDASLHYAARGDGFVSTGGTKANALRVTFFSGANTITAGTFSLYAYKEVA